MGILDVTFDPARRRFHLLADGDLDGPTFRRGMAAWIAGAAGLLHLDRFYDLRGYVGTVDNDDVRHVAHLMREAGGDTPEGCTVFVSPDPGFAFWARAMRLELPRRRMEVVATTESAEALLAEPG